MKACLISARVEVDVRVSITIRNRAEHQQKVSDFETKPKRAIVVMITVIKRMNNSDRVD